MKKPINYPTRPCPFCDGLIVPVKGITLRKFMDRRSCSKRTCRTQYLKNNKKGFFATFR